MVESVESLMAVMQGMPPAEYPEEFSPDIDHFFFMKLYAEEEFT